MLDEKCDLLCECVSGHYSEESKDKITKNLIYAKVYV